MRPPVLEGGLDDRHAHVGPVEARILFEIIRDGLEELQLHGGRPRIEGEPDHDEALAARQPEIAGIENHVVPVELVGDLEIIVFGNAENVDHGAVDALRNAVAMGGRGALAKPDLN